MQKHIFFTSFILISLMLIEQTVANVMGFDFGSSFVKMTLVQPGKQFAIVENTASKRKTENQVTLGKENRLYGADSFIEHSRYPKTTFIDMIKLVGQEYSEEKVQSFVNDYYWMNELVEDDRGMIAYKVIKKEQDKNGEDVEEEQILYSEEVVSMMLKYGKKLAETQAEGTVRECVITVPSYFGQSERRMFIDAAELAGLSVLQLVHENTAAATLYGIERLDKDKDHTVLFYNMGGMDTEVNIVKYSTVQDGEGDSAKHYEHIEVLAEAYDRHLGGKDFDVVLVNLIANTFNSMEVRQGKIDVRDNTKALRRLFKESVKIKDVLSSNKQTLVKIPELHDYDTVKFDLQRSQFEEASADLLDRVRAPLDKVLDKAGLTMEDIDAIELLGGGIRVPKVQEILQEAVGDKELGTHINGDEAMCFGSAFIASNSSKSFKVRKNYLTQHPTFDIELQITPLNPDDNISEEEQIQLGEEQDGLIQYEKQVELYKQTDFLGQKKTIAIKYDKDMQIEAYANHDCGYKEHLASYTIHEITKTAQNDVAMKEGSSKPKVNLQFELSRSQLLNLVKAYANIDELYEVEQKSKKSPSTDSEDGEEQASTEEHQQEETTEGEITLATRAVKFDLTKIDEQLHGKPTLSKDQMKEAKNRLNWYEKRDEDKIKTDIAKNDLEALIYSFRDWLQERGNQKFVVAEKVEKHLEELAELAEWLDEDGEFATYQKYNSRSKDLRKDYDKYKERKQEHNLRETAVSEARHSLRDTLDKVEELVQKKPWITEDQLKDVTDIVEETTEWLTDKEQKQSQTSLTDDPVLTQDMIADKLKRVSKIYDKVQNTKKPKKPKTDSQGESSGDDNFINFNGQKMTQDEFNEMMANGGTINMNNKQEQEQAEDKKEDQQEQRQDQNDEL